MIFRDQDFEVVNTSSSMELTGKDLLDGMFNLRDISAWGMFGTLLAYVVFFRGNQYFLFALQTKKIHLPFGFGRKATAPASSVKGRKKTPELEMKVTPSKDDTASSPNALEVAAGEVVV